MVGGVINNSSFYKLLLILFNNFMYLFTFILGCVGSCCCVGFSLVVGSRNYSLVAACRLLNASGFSCLEHRLYSAWVSVVVAQCWVWLPGCRLNSSLVAPGHVELSWVRDQIPVSCIVRQDPPLSHQLSPLLILL